MSTLMMGAGLVMSAIGKIQEGKAMASAEKVNAQIAGMQASQVEAAGAYEIEKLKRAKAQTAGMQRARYAKSGVVIDEGSPLEVMADTAAQFEMDIAATRYNTAIEAGRYRYESRYRRGAAGRYAQAGYVGGAATLLQGWGSQAVKKGK